MEEHPIHGERYRVEPEAWERIRPAERVLAVGTTTVRVLETVASGAPLVGRTDLFITPGFAFRRVDHLLTNFHLPRSTLLALVMAFAGVEVVRDLYAAGNRRALPLLFVRRCDADLVNQLSQSRQPWSDHGSRPARRWPKPTVSGKSAWSLEIACG